MTPFSGKTAVVTGAGRGIGAAVAESLAELGASVVLVSRTESEIRSRHEILKKRGLPSFPIAADVSDELQVIACFNQSVERFGPVDILVNCAAIIAKADVESMTLPTWNRIQAINVTGTFLCCQQAVRQMKGRGGVIVNVSSLAGISGTEKFPGYSAYTASKFAVIGLTESFAAETKAMGIRVNCVAPGAVDTAMLRQAAPTLRANATAMDIARIIIFACDNTQSGSLNGSCIPVHSNL